MKRGKKLIIMAAVLAALIVVTVVVQSIVAKNEEAATEEADTSVTFLTVDPEAVTAIGWQYNDEAINLDYADGQWTNADDAAFPVDPANPDTMLDAIAEVTASRAFTAEDESEYGLDEPAYTVWITTDTEVELTIGDASEISGEYYASIGDGKIYLVDSALPDAFAYGLWDILQMESIPDMTALNGIDITTADGEQNMAYLENSEYSYTDAYTWFLLNSGAYHALGSAADTLAENLTNLSWLSCENYNATEEDLAEYGLDTHNATVILSYAQAVDGADDETDTTDATDETDTTDETEVAETVDATFVLEIGGFTEGGYYARIQGSNMVYLIDAELSQSILSASYSTLRPTDVCLLDWGTVDSFDVTLDGETYTFERGVTAVSDDEGNVEEEPIFLMNGEQADYDLVYGVLDAVYAMSATGTTAEAPGAAEIAFTFHRDTETFTDIDLTFYRLDSASCIVGFNGDTYLTVARTDVVSLIEAVNAIILE